MIDLIMQKMILQCAGDLKKHDIAHFIKVHSYARLIGHLEKLDVKTMEILEISAIVHDIACPLCREKYGSTLGAYQEKEGPVLVKEFLQEFALPDETVSRIMFLVGHHHSYDHVQGIDHQILLEADFLVNGDEMKLDQKQISTMRDRIFKTESGMILLNAIYDLS